MGIFRLFRGELKKIFLGPGIFIMSGLLILILALAPQFFTPSEKQDVSKDIIIVGETVSERFSTFDERFVINDNGVHTYTSMKEQADAVKQFIDLSTSPYETLYTKLTQVSAAREDFSVAILSATDDSAIPGVKAKLQILLDNINELKATYLGYSKKDIPQILVTKSTDADINFILTNFIAKVELNINKDTLEAYRGLEDNISANRYVVMLTEALQKTKDISYEKTTLQALYNDYYTTPSATLNTIYNEARAFVSTAGSSNDGEDLLKIDNFLNRFLSISDDCENILRYGLLETLSNKLSDKELASYQGEAFVNFNSYEIKENLAKYKYLFEQGKADKDYANPLAFNYNSNAKTTAYDYMYFVMEIMSFLIIAYCVILASSMIAGEHSAGTLKMLAIRPYKRYKIMFAKILATLFFALVFMLITMLVSFITGIIIYDLNSLPMLLVFNAKHVFTLPAIVVYLIYFACVFIKIWTFVMIAFTISTIFKNGIVATIISVMLYFLTAIVTFVASGANWVKYILTANLDLFKYFGGSFIIKGSSVQALTNLFISPVFSDTNVLFSAIIISVLMVALHILTYVFFTKKDIQ